MASPFEVPREDSVDEDGTLIDAPTLPEASVPSSTKYETHWVHWMLRVLWVLGSLTAIVFVPFQMKRMSDKEYETHEIAWFLAGTFVGLAVPIALWEIMQHVHHFTNPSLQRPIIRILWLVPIYSLNSYLAMLFKDIAIYINTGRECYEAYVIYSFLCFLMAAVGGEERIVRILLAREESPQHMFPFNCGPFRLRQWSAGWGFLTKVKNGVLSYVVLRLLCTALALFAEVGGVYCESEFNFKCLWPYLALVTNFSQCWALYCLVLIYHVLHEELLPIKPLPKFLSIKLVVFFSFWQGVAVAILVHVGVIKQNPAWTDYTVDDVATGMQDFLICIEMFFAALAHKWVFSYKDFRSADSGAKDVSAFFNNLFHGVLDVRDVAGDLGQHARDVKDGITETIGLSANKFEEVEDEDEDVLDHAVMDGADPERGFKQDESPQTEAAEVTGRTKEA